VIVMTMAILGMMIGVMIGDDAGFALARLPIWHCANHELIE
jgi:hypothetical protein